MTRLILFFAVILVVSSCKTNVSSTTELAKKFGVEQLKFEFLSSKSKLSFKNQKQELSSAVDIRMAKDSLIWLSARPAFGIEAARMLIRRDSAFLVNRLEKSYIAVDINELTKQVNFDGDFSTLQALLLGNVPEISEAVAATKDDNYFIVKQEHDLFNTAMYVSRGNKKLTKFSVTQSEGMNSLFVDYTDFGKVDGQQVPFQVKALANYFNQKENQIDQTQIEIEHKKIELTNQKMDFPFAIPASYERKEFKK